MTGLTMVLWSLPVPVAACEGAGEPGGWLVPSIAGGTVTGTDALMFRTVDNEPFELWTDEGGAVQLEPVPVGETFENLVVARPSGGLEPDTSYLLASGGLEAEFSTHSGPTEAPDPPILVEQERTEGLVSVSSCTFARAHRFFLEGVDSSALLVVDVDGDTDVPTDDPLQATGGTFRPMFDGEGVVTLLAEDVGRRVSFGIIDQAGQWSGWTEVEVAGCGCATGDPHGALVPGLLSLVGLTRRRRQGAPRVAIRYRTASACSASPSAS